MPAGEHHARAAENYSGDASEGDQARAALAIADRTAVQAADAAYACETASAAMGSLNSDTGSSWRSTTKAELPVPRRFAFVSNPILHLATLRLSCECV